MNSSFQTFFSGVSIGKKLLPLAHSTDGWSFRSISRSGFIEATYCPYYKEDLVYTFYARPAYKASMGGDADSHSTRAPVCILLKPESMDRPKRIMPFDSGAMHKKLYDSYIDSRMSVKDFELGENISSANDLIETFYDDALSYILSKPRQTVVHDASDFEMDGYHRLILAAARGGPDDRRSTIEVQFSSDIKLSSGRVMAVVMPDRLSESPGVRNFIENDLNSILITYAIYHAPSELFSAVIFQKVLDFYISIGVLRP